MSYSKKQYEHIFTNMSEYMLTNDNILRYRRNRTDISEPEKKVKIKKLVKISQNNIFYPPQHDELFWCFYIALKGKEYYDFNHNKSFIYEKEFKINTVELLREKKDLLKIEKIKKNVVEDELVNSKRISLVTLHALCIIYKISIIYVWGRKYTEFLYGDENKNIIIGDAMHRKCGIYESIKESEITDIYNQYWHIDNYLKPLRGLSAYTIKELHDICNKLNIKIVDTTGKNKTKKKLYENISENI